MLQAGIIDYINICGEDIPFYLPSKRVNHLLDHEVENYHLVAAVYFYLSSHYNGGELDFLNFIVPLSEWGLSYVVPALEIGLDDETTFAVRVGRFSPSRVLRYGSPVETNYLNITAKQDSMGLELITAYWCSPEDIGLPRGLEYWFKRAFVPKSTYGNIYTSTIRAERGSRNKRSYCEFS